MPLPEKLAEIQNIVPGILKGLAQNAIAVLQVNAVAENMHSTENPGKNTTEKLYQNTRKLARSLLKNQPGHIERVDVSGGKLELDWGIDLSVVPYARIHEYGGKAGRNLSATIPKRPYMTPSNSALQKALPNLMQKAFDEIGKILK